MVDLDNAPLVVADAHHLDLLDPPQTHGVQEAGRTSKYPSPSTFWPSLFRARSKATSTTSPPASCTAWANHTIASACWDSWKSRLDPMARSAPNHCTCNSGCSLRSHLQNDEENPYPGKCPCRV